MQKNAPQSPLFGQSEPFLLIFAKFAPFSSPYILYFCNRKFVAKWLKMKNAIKQPEQFI